MSLKPVTRKNFRRYDREGQTRVEVLVPASVQRAHKFIRMSFPVSGLGYAEIDEDHCVLLPAGGPQVTIKAGYDKLVKMLSSGEDTIDLKGITGPAVLDAPCAELLSDKQCLINIRRENNSRPIGKAVKITMFVLPEARSLNLKEYSFMSDEIEHSWGDHSRPGYGYLKLLAKKPFKTINGFYFKMGKKEFMARLTQAQTQGRTELDLREATRITSSYTPLTIRPF